jgi:hypothetical protein
MCPSAELGASKHANARRATLIFAVSEKRSVLLEYELRNPIRAIDCSARRISVLTGHGPAGPSDQVKRARSSYREGTGPGKEMGPGVTGAARCRASVVPRKIGSSRPDPKIQSGLQEDQYGGLTAIPGVDTRYLRIVD